MSLPWYLSVPVSVEIKKQLAKNIYTNIDIGLKFSFLPNFRYDQIDRYSNEELQESREVYAMYLLSNSNHPKASLVLSGGLYFILKKCIIKTNLVYNKSFSNILKGEYQFGNLLVSEPTRGDYKISGDYFALTTTIYFKIKKKYKKKKQH